MDSQKKRTLNVVTAVITIVAAIAGFVLIGLLSVLNGSGAPFTFGEQLNAFIQTLQNMASVDPSNSMQFVKTALIIALFGITYVVSVFPFGYEIKIVLSLLNNTPFCEQKYWFALSTNISVKLRLHAIAAISKVLTFFGIVKDNKDCKL